MLKQTSHVASGLIGALFAMWFLTPLAPAGGGVPSRVTYLVVTSAALADSFQSLADYRAAQFGPGRTAVVTTEAILAVTEGATPAEKIHNYLQNNYKSWGLEYVVLGGDDTVVPARLWEDADTGRSGPTDLYYAALDPDAGEVVPALSVGRIPVRDAAQAAAYIAKVIAYETGGRAAVANRFLLAGARITQDVGGDSLGYDVVNDGLAQFRRHAPVSDAEQSGRRLLWDGLSASAPANQLGILFDTISSWDDAGPGSFPISSARLAAKWNLGWEQAILVATGRAPTGALSLSPVDAFTRDDAAALTGLAASVVATAGYAGAFQDVDDPCLAEALLRNPRGGALVFFGTGGPGVHDNTDPYGGATAYFLMEYHSWLTNGTCATYGQAWRQTKLAAVPWVSSAYPSPTMAALVFLQQCTNLLGDPALAAPPPPVWPGAAVTVTATSVSGVGDTFWAQPAFAVTGATDWERRTSWPLRSLTAIFQGQIRATGQPATAALAECSPRIALLDLSATRAHLRAGQSAPAALVRGSAAELALEASVGLPNRRRLTHAAAGTVRLVRPVIQSVTWDSALQPGAQLTIRGHYFGKALPTVYLERRRGGFYSWDACKVARTQAFADAAGRPFASVSDPVTGEATVYAVYPARRSGQEETGWLILRGGAGLDAFPFALPDHE
jgi:hypothetical protein